MFDLFSQPPETETGAAESAIEVRQPLAAAPDAGIDDAIDVFTKATVLQLQFRRPGTERKVSTGAIDVRKGEDDPTTDKSLLRVAMRYLDSPELKAIEKHDNETASYINAKKSGPAFANQGGFHLVALALKPEIDAWIKLRLDERQQLIGDFLAAFRGRCVDTRARLGVLAGEVKWPTLDEVREAFGVTVRYMSFGYTDEDAAREWRREALSECRQALRFGFRDIVDHLADRLVPGPDGKVKVFRDSLIENFAEFAASFEGRNLANDAELADLVNQAGAILRGVAPEDLRGTKGEGLRAAVAARVAEIKTAVDGLTIDQPTRRYSAEEE